MKRLLIACLFGLSACSTDKIVQKPVLVEKPQLVLQDAGPIEQIAFEWVVITKDNFAQKIKELEAKKAGQIVLFALTADDYEILSMNVADMRRYIEQQNAIILAYKDYYKPAPETPPEKPKSWSLW